MNIPMGFDIAGLKAKSKKGEYFRNNVWWWRSMWDFVCTVCEDIIKKEEHANGHTNSGQAFSEIRAGAIAIRIQTAIDDGRAAAYEKQVEKSIRAAKKTNKGKRAGEKGYDWSEAYPFTVQNLQEFQEFVKESGGFQIL